MTTKYVIIIPDGAADEPLEQFGEKTVLEAADTPNMDKISKDKTYHIHCAGGYRSMIFSSILKSRGFDKVIDVAGGFKAISETDLPITNFVCPTTLK